MPCHTMPCNLFGFSASAMSKSHSSSRTVEQWVDWAHSEGFVDIVEKPAKGEGKLGVFPTDQHLLQFFFLFSGKVYCSLCASFLTPTSQILKQHCQGRSSKDGVFQESPHAKKVKLRESRQPEVQPAAPSLQPNIIINVCEHFICHFTFPWPFLSSPNQKLPCQNPQKRHPQRS